MKFVIDRFEGNYAVCENLDNNEMRDIGRAALPEGVKEGSVIIIQNEGILLDQSETSQRTKEIKELMDSLWE